MEISSVKGKLMQRTILKDCEGKEVYEGDIIIDEEASIYQCVWSDADYGFMFQDGSESIDNKMCLGDYEGGYCKVIGNIYENPDLLNTEN